MQHPDKDSVLVAQCILSKIIRVYYKGPKKGKIEVFADGLPGIVDNIRESANGKSFWIGIPHPANRNWRPLAQMLSEYPSVRRVLSFVSLFSAIYQDKLLSCPKNFDNSQWQLWPQNTMSLSKWTSMVKFSNQFMIPTT
jgi:hypothetical protein